MLMSQPTFTIKSSHCILVLGTDTIVGFNDTINGLNFHRHPLLPGAISDDEGEEDYNLTVAQRKVAPASTPV